MNQIDPTPEEQSVEFELASQLLSLRQEPGPALQERVAAVPRPGGKPSRSLTFLSWGMLGLVIVMLLFISPTAKAMLGEFELVVGRIHLMIRERWPKQVGPVVVENISVSLEEARAMVPYDFSLPTYIPAQLNSGEAVSVTRLSTPLLKVLWRDLEGGFVQLTIHPLENGRSQLLIGPGSSETILIKGQPGVVVRGGWDEASRTWSHQDQITMLIWEVNGLQYKLLSYSDLITLSELEAMARSID